LNVSGKRFEVLRDVMCKSELFAGMLTDCIIDNEIVINRSPKLFEHVFAYLTDNKYPYPKKYYSELDYYLVPYDIDLLYDSHKICVDKTKKVEEDLSVTKQMLKIALDKICELLAGKPDTHCRNHYCNKLCYPKYLTCHRHRNQCCHFIDGFGSCNDETHGSIPFCDDHILDNQFDDWYKIE
jgi:hypothetical protein